MQMFEYRANFFFWSFVSMMWTVFNLFFYSILLQTSGNIAGWSPNEMYILLGTFTMIDAFTWSFFYHNMSEYTASIFNGTMTLTLTRPIQPQFLISVQGNSYTNIPRFFIGLFVLVKAVVDEGLALSLSSVGMYVAVFLISLLFIYSLWFFIATCSFWVDKLDNINELVPVTRRVWQVPRDVYTGLASTLFTVALPLSLIASLPSEALLGRASSGWVWYYLAFTLAIFAVSHFFFKLSVKKYTGIAN